MIIKKALFAIKKCFFRQLNDYANEAVINLKNSDRVTSF